MPTFNSAKTIALALQSIRNQHYDAEEIEILIVDGGSTDNTVEIAKSFGAKILINEKRLPEIAKFIGIKAAIGDLIVFNDSDEVIVSPHAFAWRNSAFLDNPFISTLATEGDVRPAGSPLLLDYYNLVGDAFSYFVNRSSVVVKYASARFAERYVTERESSTYLVFLVAPDDPPPMYDAGGHTFCRACLKNLTAAKIASNDASFVGIISSLLSRESGKFLVSKNDYVEHHSDASVSMILKKTRFRIVNNLFMAAKGGAAGFAEREKFLPLHVRVRKFLFLLYGLSVIWPAFDGAANAIKHRNPSFLWHVVFSFATAVMLCWYGVKKLMGMHVQIGTYG